MLVGHGVRSDGDPDSDSDKDQACVRRATSRPAASGEMRQVSHSSLSRGGISHAPVRFVRVMCDVLVFLGMVRFDVPVLVNEILNFYKRGLGGVSDFDMYGGI